MLGFGATSDTLYAAVDVRQFCDRPCRPWSKANSPILICTSTTTGVSWSDLPSKLRYSSCGLLSIAGLSPVCCHHPQYGVLACYYPLL